MIKSPVSFLLLILVLMVSVLVVSCVTTPRPPAGGSTTAPVAAGPKPRLAVLPFTDGRPGSDGGDGETIADLFAMQTEVRRVFEPIPRTSSVDAIRHEQRFQSSTGLTDSDTIARLGAQANAQYVVAGHISSLGNRNLILIQIIHVESLQQVAGDYRRYGEIEEVISLLPEMARRISIAAELVRSDKQTLAVLPFSVPAEINRRDAEILAQILAIDITNSGQYVVLPRTSSIQSAIDEQTIQRSEQTENENISAIGRAINAEYVLSGNVRRISTQNYFYTQILHTETGILIEGAQQPFGQISEGLTLMLSLANELTGVQQTRPEFVAAGVVPTPVTPVTPVVPAPVTPVVPAPVTPAPASLPAVPAGFIELQVNGSRSDTITGVQNEGGRAYAVRPTQNGRLVVQTSGSNVDTWMRLLGSDMRQIRYNDDIGGGNTCSRIEHDVVANQIYYFYVTGYNTSQAGRNYTITSQFTPTGQTASVAPAAQPAVPSGYPELRIGSSLSGSINRGTGADYVVRPTESGTLTVYTTSSIDTYMHAFNSSMSQIATNDDGGSGLNARIQIQVSANQIYYFRVRGYNSAVSGNYTVHATWSTGGGTASRPSSASSSSFASHTNNSEMSSFGVNFGSTFHTPLITIGANATFSLGGPLYIDAGVDIGLISSHDKLKNYESDEYEYISFFPYAGVGLFFPIGSLGLTLSGGMGFLISSYTFNADGSELTGFLPALDFGVGFILSEFFKVSYNVRADMDFTTITGILRAGILLRF